MDCRAGEGPPGGFPEAVNPETPGGTGGLGTVTVHIDPRSARVGHQANCFQSIFGSETSFDLRSWSQVTSLPV